MPSPPAPASHPHSPTPPSKPGLPLRRAPPPRAPARHPPSAQSFRSPCSPPQPPPLVPPLAPAAHADPDGGGGEDVTPEPPTADGDALLWALALVLFNVLLLCCCLACCHREAICARRRACVRRLLRDRRGAKVSDAAAGAGSFRLDRPAGAPRLSSLSCAAQGGWPAAHHAEQLRVCSPAKGATPTFGTNPIAMGFPKAGGPPLTFDMATSAIALFGVLTSKAKGEPLPEGVAYAKDGSGFTTDAADSVKRVSGGSRQSWLRSFANGS